MEVTKTTYICDNKYDVIFGDSHLKIGEFIRDVDGTFYFWPEEHGAWSDYVLVDIGEKLKELNNSENKF